MTIQPTDEAVLTFKSADEFRSWFSANHALSAGIWLRIYRKETGVATVTYAQALDQALCFGWIDGQRRPYDGRSWLTRFTPRRPGSRWSKINTQHAERLLRSGEMAPAGLEEVNAAKADGRWKAAYDSFGSATIPKDFIRKLAKNRKAKEFFDSLNKANRYSIAYRLQTAKTPETRKRHEDAIIEMLALGKKFH